MAPGTRIALLILCGVLATGCASVRTLADYQAGDPIAMSGTRFDIALIRKDPVALKQFRSEPPAWPVVDLPFSFVADLFFLLLPRSLDLIPGAPAPQPSP